MERIIARAETCYAQAEQYFRRTFARPAIHLDLRGQRAGVAYLDRNLLRFNGQMYRDNSEHFLRQTVAHEVAHLIAHQGAHLGTYLGDHLGTHLGAYHGAHRVPG